MTSPDVADVELALRRAAEALPNGGESRPGQVEMASAVARAIETGRSLVVQAGTGTGKSLAYLVPVVLAGVPVVVATATKALQDQLATKDLPLLAGTVEDGFSYAVLKGRSNYLCLQRVAEMGGRDEALELLPASADPPDADDPLRPGREEEAVSTAIGEQVARLVRWSRSTATGDRAELDFEPHFRAWSAVSTTARECPGPFRCPSGHECFAEEARARAAAADVVVVNTHLYGAHLASGGAVLPPHAVVVLDEAHAVEEVMTDSLGVEISPGRFRALAAAARPLLTGSGPDGTSPADVVGELGALFARALEPFAGRRVSADAITGSDAGRQPEAEEHDGPALAEVVSLALGRLTALGEGLRRAGQQAEGDQEGTRHDRVLLAAGHLTSDLTRLIELTDDEVAWVDGGAGSPTLKLSPIDVGPILSERLWDSVTGVLTSATLPVGIAERLGMPASETDLLDVGSPFDYKKHALLYVAKSLPDRRRPESEPALHAELELLIEAAGGRTLALFTSWRAMRAAAEAVGGRLPFPILSQSDLPKPALIEAFRGDEEACLFATLGFFQGVDLPGRTLSLVTIDRIPFPRPDDPVLEARRERAGWDAFSLVDLPRAGTLLAQGAGRLIRSAEDRGVVAVLDSRLATARYRGSLLARVPPMRRTVDRAEVVAFLRAITRDA